MQQSEIKDYSGPAKIEESYKNQKWLRPKK